MKTKKRHEEDEDEDEIYMVTSGRPVTVSAVITGIMDIHHIPGGGTVQWETVMMKMVAMLVRADLILNVTSHGAAGKSKWVGNLADHMADWIWEGIWNVGDDDDDDLEGV